MKKLLTILSFLMIANFAIAAKEKVKTVETKIEKTKVEISSLTFGNKTVSYNSEIKEGECWVTITVYGLLGEPLGTYTGHSWISCQLALQYALTDMLVDFFL